VPQLSPSAPTEEGSRSKGFTAAQSANDARAWAEEDLEDYQDPAPAQEPVQEEASGVAAYREYVHEAEAHGRAVDVQHEPEPEPAFKPAPAPAPVPSSEMWAMESPSNPWMSAEYKQASRLESAGLPYAAVVNGVPIPDYAGMLNPVPTSSREYLNYQVDREIQERMQCTSGLTEELEALYSMKIALMELDSQAQASYLRPHLNTPEQMHEHVLEQGLTVTDAAKFNLIEMLGERPEETVIATCALPIGAEETARILKQDILPNLPISSTAKVYLLRNITVGRVTAYDVARTRDKILSALNEARNQSRHYEFIAPNW